MALVEVHWAQRVQAPMPQISEPNLQEIQIIETCKEEWCAVTTQETAARRKWEMEHMTRLSASWTDSRPHPRIVNQLVGGNQYYVNL
jgi:formylglycine-generating enzyme required for sulfatase activity